MKKFKFTLQTVHKVREMRQEQESITLGELQAEADRAAARVAHIEAMRNESIENYVRRLNSGEQMHAAEMELNSNSFASLNNLQRDAEKVAEEKKQACVRQIELLTAAMRDVKVTDQLRETQKERHRFEFDREMQNGIDEIVSTTFARRILQK